MTTEMLMLLIKTGGMAAVIVLPIAWLFRKGGRISLDVDFGRNADSRSERKQTRQLGPRRQRKNP